MILVLLAALARVTQRVTKRVTKRVTNHRKNRVTIEFARFLLVIVFS